MEKEAKALKKEIFQMCWYMRGLSVNEGMALSFEDRKLIAEMIKDNLETTKKSGLPFF
jgi:hypothetical protein